MGNVWSDRGTINNENLTDIGCHFKRLCFMNLDFEYL